MAKKDPFSDPSLSPTLPSGDVVFGQMLGARYRLDEQLSVTDEIALWRGWDEQLGRIVLIYVLPPNHPKTTEVMTAARRASAATDARFLRVLDALEYGPSEPVSFVVCECVPGYDLCDLLSVGPIGGKAATWLVRECAEAIASLHAEGHAHGHLDLAAVDVTPRGTVRISGFVLGGLASEDGPAADDSVDEAQARDVRGLGQILYTALSGSWPQLDESQPADFGVPVIRRGVRGLAAPSQLRSSIPPVLDVICAQILAPMPDNPPLETAEDVLNMLKQVLGSADASEDLALRVQALVVAGEPDFEATDKLRDEADDPTTPTGLIAAVRSGPVRVTPAPDTSRDQVLDDYESSLAGVSYPDAAQANDAHPGANTLGSASETTADPGASYLAGADGGYAQDGESDRGDDATPRPAVSSFAGFELPPFLRGVSPVLLHRIIAGVVALVLITAGVLVFRSCSADDAPVVPSATPRATGLALLTSAVDFDPEVDGGSGGENWMMVDNAIDDNLETLWYTETYEFPETSRKKPGTGLIVGLDAAADLASVSVWTDLPGATIKLMVPAAAAGADEPPMDTVQSWREIASVSMDTDEHIFTIDSGVTSRWVMLYITVVPPVDGGYAVGIREVSVHKYI
jgi:putative peptidoglycan lipid II flippase